MLSFSFPLALAIVSEASIAISWIFLVVAGGAIVLLWLRLKACRDRRAELQNCLAEAAEQTQMILHNVRDGVISVNSEGQIELLNPVAEQLIGWYAHEAQGRSLSEVLQLCDSETRQPFPDLTAAPSLQRHRLGQKIRAALLQTRDRTEKRVDASLLEICAASGQVMSRMVLLREAAVAFASGRIATWQDRYDALTGLVNRQEFEHCLQQAIALMQPSQQEHSLCLLDLDRFREINQVCGFAAGDELLRQVSRLLQTKVRRADTIARLGGDEFAVLLYQCPTEQAMYVAQSLCEAIEKFWFEWQGQSFSVGVSIGLVNLTANSDPKTALKAADKACTIAKTQNRGGVHFYQIEPLASPGRSQIEAEQILQAIESNRLRLCTEKILPLQINQAEAAIEAVLLRMIDTEGNPVSAAAFRAAAERHRLLAILDRWTITTLFASQSRAQSPRSRYSVKLAEASAIDPQFSAFLEEQFSTYCIAPHRVGFEMAQATVQNHPEAAAALVQSLKQIGCQITIADFGTSLTALTDLAELPIDALKIHEPLIQSLLTDAAAPAIVEAICCIADRLDLKTIAPAVSTANMRRKLAAIGVDYAQGSAVAEPEMLSLLQENDLQVPQ